MSWSTERIEPHFLRVNDKLILSLGPGTGNPPQTQYVALRVVRRTLFTFLYDFLTQQVSFLPLGPQGSTPTSTYQADFVDNVQLTLQSIAQVTNILATFNQGEILQLFVGMAPRYLRTYLRQPINNAVPVMDQNIAASQSYFDPGFIDGFESPLDNPSPRTEVIAPQSATPAWALGNPVRVPIVPQFRLYLNRIVVEGITDAALLREIFLGRAPARWVSLGEDYSTVSWPATYYPGTAVVTRKMLGGC